MALSELLLLVILILLLPGGIMQWLELVQPRLPRIVYNDRGDPEVKYQ